MLGANKELPVILLTYANVEGQDRLINLERERNAIERSLRYFDDIGSVQVVSIPYGNTDVMFEDAVNYNGRICLLHFGGHAGRNALRVGSEQALAPGYAQLFGGPGVKLVFLNGCNTSEQVKLLFAAGAEAVIATTTRISDALATEFSIKFYHSLAHFHTIESSFDLAKAYLLMIRKEISENNFSKVRQFVTDDEHATLENMWILYTKNDEIKKWTIPYLKHNDEVLLNEGNKVNPESAKQVNRILRNILDTIINCIIDNMIRHEEQEIAAAKRNDQALNDDLSLKNLFSSYSYRPGSPERTRTLIAKIPSPVGCQIRKMKTLTSAERSPLSTRFQEFLTRTVYVYDNLLKLYVFTFLSDFWNNVSKRKITSIVQEQQDELKTFISALQRKNGYDSIKLVQVLLEIFEQNSITPFVDEAQLIKEAYQKDEFITAHLILQGLKQRVKDKNIRKDEVRELCKLAGDQLQVIFRYINFTYKYKLVTVRNIEILKYRDEPLYYKHYATTLYSMGKDDQHVIDQGALGNSTSSTDSHSVCLLKSDKIITTDDQYLSLFPFIIDKNSFVVSDVSSIYFLDYFTVDDNNGSTYSYRLIEDSSNDEENDIQNYTNLSIKNREQDELDPNQKMYLLIENKIQKLIDKIYNILLISDDKMEELKNKVAVKEAIEDLSAQTKKEIDGLTSMKNERKLHLISKFREQFQEVIKTINE